MEAQFRPQLVAYKTGGRTAEKDLSGFLGLNYDHQPMTRPLAKHLAFAAMVPLALGCASQSDSNAKQVRDLSEQVRRLQSMTDRLEERLSALENARGKSQPRLTSSMSPPDTVPDLPVVRASPDTASTAADVRSSQPESEESRPLIVGEGTRVETRNSGNESAVVTAARRAKEKSGNEPTKAKRANGATEPGKKSP